MTHLSWVCSCKHLSTASNSHSYIYVASFENGLCLIDTYSETETEIEEISDVLSSPDPSTSEGVDVPNLLSRLKCPTPSDLSRKRKWNSNPPKSLVRVLSPLILVSHLSKPCIDWRETGHWLLVLMKKLQATISAQHFSNTTAVSGKLPSNRPTQKQQLNFATDCIKPAIA